MANKLLSVSLGTGTAKLAEIAANGKRVSIYSAYDVTFSDGLCEDGLILDAEALADELKAYISKYKIKSKKLVFSIASKRIASKEVIIPYVKEKQIADIVKINGPEYFPVANIDDYSLNYSIIEVVKSAENKQYRLSVTATPLDLLEGYYELAANLKMPIEATDYAGNAYLQVLKKQALDSDVNAVLQLGRENTVINIMAGGILVMQRSVSYGLDAILQAVSDSFKLDEEDSLAFVEDNDISKICAAYSDVDDVVRTIFTSVSRIFDFYNQRSNGHPITKVKFIGDGTLINGIGNAIQENLQIPTEEILTLNSVDVRGRTGLTAEHATNFMANIGAIIDPVNMRFVKKKDGEETAKSEEKLPWGIVVVSVLASVILVGGSFAIYFINNSSANELRTQKNALASMRQVETKLKDTQALSAVVADFYDSTKGADDSIGKLITDLETILPEGMSIDTISIDNGRVSLSAGGIGKRSVAKIITELKALNYVKDVNVDYVSEIDEGLNKYDDFVMTFTILQVEDDNEDSTIEVSEEGGEQ